MSLSPMNGILLFLLSRFALIVDIPKPLASPNPSALHCPITPNCAAYFSPWLNRAQPATVALAIRSGLLPSTAMELFAPWCSAATIGDSSGRAAVPSLPRRPIRQTPSVRRIMLFPLPMSSQPRSPGESLQPHNKRASECPGRIRSRHIIWHP